MSVAWNFFAPLRGTNSYITHYLLSCFLQLNSLKRTTNVPAVDLSRLNTLRGIKTALFTPNRYDQHPPSFLYGSPPPPPRIRVKHSSTLTCLLLKQLSGNTSVINLISQETLCSFPLMFEKCCPLFWNGTLNVAIFDCNWMLRGLVKRRGGGGGSADREWYPTPDPPPKPRLFTNLYRSSIQLQSTAGRNLSPS